MYIFSAMQEVIEDSPPSAQLPYHLVDYFGRKTGLCYLENWLDYYEYHRFYELIWNKNFDVRVKYGYSFLNYAYLHFTGTRPDDYDVQQRDWLNQNFDQIIGDAKLSINHLAQTGNLVPLQDFKYGYEYAHIEREASCGMRNDDFSKGTLRNVLFSHARKIGPILSRFASFDLALILHL